MNTLLESIRSDVEKFMQANDELFFNERDFQMHLAVYLRSLEKYDDVDVEYYVPHKTLKDYIWGNELRLDILVEKDGEYAPIELKYKTKEVKKNLPRFGETISDILVMKDQQAHNLARYDFWKDVRRVELVRNRFSRVKGGLAVFYTNDETYLKCPREQSLDFLLSMSEGKHSKVKNWSDASSATAKGHPNFEVEKEYSIQWQDRKVAGVDMHYCIVTI